LRIKAISNGTWKDHVIPAQIADDLAPHVAGRDPDEWLFTTARGARLDLYNFRGRWFHPALRRGADLPVIRIHDLRHIACSSAMGMPAPGVARWAAHSTAVVPCRCTRMRCRISAGRSRTVRYAVRG
jgi:integrase